MGTIFNIQRYCLHDGDGIRTTVFFKGCPLRCKWCHNPEGLSPEVSVAYNSEKCTLCGRCAYVCSGRSIKDGKMQYDRSECNRCGKCVTACLCGANETFGREASADEVMKEVLRDKVYYKTSGGGMTLSGGEPSMQAQFALELIEKAKNAGVSVSVETCGYGDPSFFKSAADAGVTFLYDIKCIDSEKHKRLTGVGNERIISNLRLLFDKGADVILRLPMVPGENDCRSDIDGLCEFMRENSGKYRYAEIMPYHSFGIAKAKRLGNDSVFEAADASEGDIERWRSAFSVYGVDVKISR